MLLIINTMYATQVLRCWNQCLWNIDTMFWISCNQLHHINDFGPLLKKSKYIIEMIFSIKLSFCLLLYLLVQFVILFRSLCSFISKTNITQIYSQIRESFYKYILLKNADLVLSNNHFLSLFDVFIVNPKYLNMGYI